MKTVLMNAVAWAAATSSALLLALGSPREPGIVGRLPVVVTHRLDQRPVVLPQDLAEGKTLALITFSRAHGQEADSWVRGLQLDTGASGPWMRLPVLSDPGSDAMREAKTQRLSARYPSGLDRASMVPVFADSTSFARTAGLADTRHAYAVVLNHQGEVLTSVAGPFDEDKAEVLRASLRSPI